VSNREIFFYPGLIGADFAFSLFDLHRNSTYPGFFWLLSLLLALLFWGKLIQIAVAILRKVFKFEQRPMR